MNVFIYDSFLNHKKYDRLLAKIETRITDLGLNGKISRLSLTRNVNDTVKNELRRGATTIIAVGDNKTVNQIANALSTSQVPLGIIPVGEKNNDIAKSLGIESSEDACDILSARLLTKLDLGLAGKTCFLGYAAIKNQGTIISMSDNYTVEVATRGVIRIFNLAHPEIKLPSKIKVSPSDGVLELAICAQSGKKFFAKTDEQSVFKIKKVAINNPGAQLILDNATPVPLPAEITVVKQALNVIVGKNRNF